MDSAMENVLSHSTALPVTRSKASGLQNQLPSVIDKYLEFWTAPGSSSFVPFQSTTTLGYCSYMITSVSGNSSS